MSPTLQPGIQLCWRRIGMSPTSFFVTNILKLLRKLSDQHNCHPEIRVLIWPWPKLHPDPIMRHNVCLILIIILGFQMHYFQYTILCFQYKIYVSKGKWCFQTLMFPNCMFPIYFQIMYVSNIHRAENWG